MFDDSPWHIDAVGGHPPIIFNTASRFAHSVLSAAERRAYILADNKLALNAGWDQKTLATELQALVDLEFDTTLTGFSLAEIDLVLDNAADADSERPDRPEDALVAPAAVAVRHRGDLWQLGRHRLLCGDALEADDYARLVWDYAGISSIGANRMKELAMHPTVKPVALVADAIRDCSKRGDIVLDAFAGRLPAKPCLVRFRSRSTAPFRRST